MTHAKVAKDTGRRRRNQKESGDRGARSQETDLGENSESRRSILGLEDRKVDVLLFEKSFFMKVYDRHGEALDERSIALR